MNELRELLYSWNISKGNEYLLILDPVWEGVVQCTIFL